MRPMSGDRLCRKAPCVTPRKCWQFDYCWVYGNPPPDLQVDLWPTLGHERRSEVIPTARPDQYAHLGYQWLREVWVCMTCGRRFVSPPFPEGTGLYAKDNLQRLWVQHLTSEQPSP